MAMNHRSSNGYEPMAMNQRSSNGYESEAQVHLDKQSNNNKTCFDWLNYHF